RRRHTRFSRDWSSDVCSSDLLIFVSACLLITGCGTANKKPLNRADEVENGMQAYSKVVSSNNKFAFELLSILSEEQENVFVSPRSEERRVGKECRSWW